jgi:hypothetical protein
LPESFTSSVRQPLGVGVDQVASRCISREPVEAGRGTPLAVQRRPGRADRDVDVLGAAVRHERPRPAGVRVLRLERPPDSASTDLPPMSIWNRSMDRRYAAPAALPCPILRLTMTSSGGSAVPGPGRLSKAS